MKKILLLTDLSEASGHALAFTNSLFSNLVCNIHLLCVYPPDALGGPVYGSDPTRSAYSERLNDLLMELHRNATTNWHTFRSSDCPGDWLDVVRKSLEVEEYDYVMLGANADGTHELFGDSITALTRQLRANVLVVPVHATVRPVRRVVLATDFASLKNCKLLSPVKEVVLFKGATLTLLSIDTPDSETIPIDKEIHVRTFLAPVDPGVVHIKAANALSGFETYIDRHSVDLLVVLPNYNARTGSPAAGSDALAEHYPLPVPLLTLYDDGNNDLPQRISVLADAGEFF